jgi:putative DNA primase/helicase
VRASDTRQARWRPSSAEDSVEHTLTPRAIAAGGDLSCLHFFRSVNVSAYHGDEERPAFLIPDDLPLLDHWLAERKARVVVLDPIVAMIPVSLNTHRDQHVRRALAPLAHIANERSDAVIAVMHLNKDREADALNRLSGSIGFGGAARSVLLFAQDPDDPQGEAGNRRILAHVKCNVGPRQASIAFRIEPRTLDTPNGAVHTSIAIRDGNAHVSANDLLGAPTSVSEATARSEARDFLVLELEAGPAPTTDLKRRADDAGIAWRTIERAKKQLGIRARKNGVGWLWQLPDIPQNPLAALTVWRR